MSSETEVGRSGPLWPEPCVECPECGGVVMERTESAFGLSTMTPCGHTVDGNRWRATVERRLRVPLCPEYDHANVEKDGITTLTPQRCRRDAGHSGDHLATVNAGTHQGTVLKWS